jgi:LysR family transcriptional regulator, benzoate and cis,cis-muconate-responsive activator of ben and cat genes
MIRPQLRELECFIAVADHLNFSKAARQLNLSQPPLTRHIKSLEFKLGTRLFERNTHSVFLTDHGRLYLEDVRAIIARLDQASEMIRRARHGETDRLRLAFVGALLDEKLVELVKSFRRAHPACQLQIADLPPSSQLDLIRAGELDGGFIGAKPAQATKDLAYAVWRKEPLLLVVPETHPLAEIQVLRWRDLTDRSWVMVSPAAAPAFRNQFAEICHRHKLAPRIVQESDRVPAILTMVAAGSGLTLVPQTVEHLISKGVAFRELPSPKPVLFHAFGYRPRYQTKALKDFLSILQKGK